ncbi:MAG: biotin--[acetyl-CoA-carboxylase] ligase [Burkholderiales bacterium]|nr:biotin--[acetyl-CoA-carboxylase] ligase [Burkholderiales bacterium]
MPTREQPLQWGAQALWQQLEPLLPGLSVEVVRRAESTNSALLERARALPDAPRDSADVRVRRSVESAAFGRRAVDLQPCLLVAEHQSGGRGRQGRLWQSAPGASLTFSLGLPLALADWSGLSLAVGVALCEALDPAAPDAPGPHLGLKWPNDLWLMRSAAAGAAAEGRKLGGILIETVAAGAQRLVVVGIGLNVLPFDTDGVNTGFASLRELDPAASAPQVLARLALPLVQALKEFEREGFAAFAARYAARDLLYGLPVRTTLAEVPDGIARGVSAQGALLVQSAAGIASVSSGEVSVRLAPPAAPLP